MSRPPADQALRLYTADELELEAFEACPDSPRGLLVACHPHTEMGGTMNSKVSHTLYLAFRDRNFHALRFNFRGAGGSGGSYDAGRGERLDVAAAWRHLLQASEPVLPVDAPRVVGGFSFGSFVGMAFAHREQACSHRIAIAPPLKFDYDFSFLEDPADLRPLYIVVGADDPFCPIPLVEQLLERLRKLAIPVLASVIPGANHMFDRCGHVLREELSSIAAQICGQQPGEQRYGVRRL